MIQAALGPHSFSNMYNITVNESNEDNFAAKVGTSAADGVLLLIIIIGTPLNLLVLAALLTASDELVKSIRVILFNSLVACVIGDLGSSIYHISTLIFLSGSPSPIHSDLVCFSVTFLDITSSSGRVLFAVYYALTVFIVVRWWSQPVLAPRNTKYFIIAAVFVWLLAIIVYIPVLVYEEVSKICASFPRGSLDVDFRLTIYATLPYFFVSAIPIGITPVILIIISCYIKHNSIGEHVDSKKALVKFGFFLLIIQGVNGIAQIVSPLLLVIGISLKSTSMTTTVAVTTAVSDLSRIPTNLLIIIFFKPVLDKLKKWICCYFSLIGLSMR